MSVLKFKKTNPAAILPTKAYENDSGWDLYALFPTTLHPHRATIIETGIACEFPLNVWGMIRDRSSVATKKELFVVAGIIDNAYKNQIGVAMYNPNNFSYTWQQGEKIAQMILMPLIDIPAIEVTELKETERNMKGFGSSGG